MSHFGRIIIAAVLALGMVAAALSIVSALLGPTVDTLATLASMGGAKEIVGDGGGNVGDFSVSLDKTLAVYAKRGSPSERTDEIWLLSLSDGSSQMVYRRPDWQISQPHLSPDGQTIAFLAE